MSNVKNDVHRRALFAGGVLNLMTILVISSFAFTFFSGKAGATVYYVGGTGPGNYTTIQAAVDAANPGDTVFVYGGIYVEDVVINKSISLVGEDRDTTVIDGGGAGSTVTITADWVNVTGFTMTSGEVAVDIGEVDNCTVFHTIISNSNTGVDLGVFLMDTFDNTLSDNVFYGNSWGIKGQYTHRPMFVNNTFASGGGVAVQVIFESSDGIIANNTVNQGTVLFAETYRMTIVGNAMAGLGIDIAGYKPEHWNTHAIDTSNTVGGRPIYYWKNRIGGTIPLDAGQVILANSKGVLVENLDLYNTSAGIALGFSTSNRIVRNSVTNSGSGIYLRHSDGNTIANNTVTMNIDGISLFGDPGQECGHNFIENNTAIDGGYGIRLYYARHDTILNNIVTGNQEGIHLVDSWNHTIASNAILSNGYGIHMWGWSDARIFANRIEDSDIGMAVEYDFATSESLIFHNEFINNTQQAYEITQNAWDDGYPSGGNYWSDYSGVDYYSGPNQDQFGGDDIGDTPHPIPGGNRVDRYPLMRPGGPYPPLQPRNLTAVAGDSKVMLSWIPPLSNGRSPITNYEVYRGDVSGGEVFLTELGNVLNYTDLGLNNGQTYFYQVSAKNAVGESPRSDEANATPARVPAEPTGLTAVGGDGFIALNWTPPSDNGGAQITNYTIYRGTSSGGESYLCTIGNVTDYLDSGLANGVTLYYEVAAVNLMGQGPNSTEANATPGGTPFEPLNLEASPGDTRINLTWMAPSYDGGHPITNYTIYRGDFSGGETFLVEIGNVLAYADLGLVNGHTYYYQVAAKNVLGEGPRSNEANATPATAPGQPENLTATGGDRQIALAWNAPQDDGGSPITNYTIYRGDFSGGETFLVEIGNVTDYTDTGLTNGHTYFYQVSARNAIGEGERSNEANATPAGPPMAPRNLMASASSTQVELSWSPPVDDGGIPIINYRIFRGATSGAETFLAEVGDVRAYTDTGLTNGQRLYYTVSAVNAVGESPVSSEVDATPGNVPSQPLGLEATASKGLVMLAWQPPADDGGFPVTAYNVYRGMTSGGEVLLDTVGAILTYADTAVINGNTYYYWITAVNLLGEGQNSQEAFGSPQDIPPACVISTPRLGATVSGKVTISGLASDSDGQVQSVEVRIDTQNWTIAAGNTSWNYLWDTAEVSDGEHTIYARSYDGNSHSPETSINVTVSNQAGQGDQALPIVIAGLGVTGGTAALLWLLEPFRIALIGFLAFMGTKLRRDEVFENEKRDMIRGYLAANPGANYASIRADLGIANGTLVYHLNTMEKEEFIRSWHDGRFKRFALKDHPIADIQPRLTDIELIVLQTLQNSPGLTQEIIAKEVGVSQPTISYHMKKLSELGFVKVSRHGIRNHYTAVIKADLARKEADTGENHGGGGGMTDAGVHDEAQG